MADQPLAYRYRDTAIRTANPLQLVVILYDAAIHSLKEAQEHLKHGDIERRSRSVNRATSVIAELQGCLNFKEGGEIALSLDRLYNYMKKQVFKANVEQSSEPLAEVVALLEELRSAWREVAAQAQKLEASPAASELLKNGTTGQAMHQALSISG